MPNASSRITSFSLALIAFLIGALTIAAALTSEWVFGLEPCELCLEQRLAYYWGLPALALILLAHGRIPARLRAALLAVPLLIFMWGTWRAVYHAGVEWGFWPGPAGCTGLGGQIDFGSLSGSFETIRVVPCDVVQFEFLGLSMAGYNALISLGLCALIAGAAWRALSARG